VARLTRVPLVGRVLERWLFDGDDILYLPDDRVIPIHQSVELPTQTVLPSHVVEHFIDQATHHWVMNFCICREGEHCREYPRNLGCLFLGEAVEGINPALGRRVSKAEAHAHVRQCREAGLVHLIGRNKLDSVWLGVGPKEKLLTICNCCPCCCLWRMLPDVATAIGERVTRMPGVSVSVSERCEGCGTCTQGTCFVDAISLGGDRAEISDACRGCGRCVKACPNGAIDISVDFERWIGLSIDRIARLVDLS
jgi:ferredoxin